MKAAAPRKKASVPRKKSCQQCSSAKTRCDLQRPRCSTCSRRGLACHYVTVDGSRRGDTSSSLESSTQQSSRDGENQVGLSAPSNNVHQVLPSGHSPHVSGLNNGSSPNDALLSSSPVIRVQLPDQGNIRAGDNAYSLQIPSPGAHPHLQHPNVLTEQQADVLPILQSSQECTRNSRSALDFSNLDLLPASAVDSISIGDRWLTSLLPLSPTIREKQMPLSTVQYLWRMLSTYPKMMLRPGVLPPIIHPLQAVEGKMPPPLANCISLVRMWEGRAAGSEAIIIGVVRQEMDRLMQEYETYNQVDHLAACQAYLLYAIMTFSPSNPDLSLVDRSTMMNLQALSSRASLKGLVCAAELATTRPGWESWIVAEAQRRTLYTTYMFDNVFNALSGSPYFIAEELAGLPAPSSKLLWEANCREDWEREYNLQLGKWDGDEMLRIGDLWPDPGGFRPERRRKIDRWLESVDGFGMMVFAVVVHTYGSYL